MGTRGRRYVTDHLSWDGVAESMSEAYRWVLDPSSAVPACIRLD
jgi:hypothetical protein